MDEAKAKLETMIKRKANELMVLIGKASEPGYDVYLNEAFFPSLVFDEVMTGKSDLFLIIEREIK